MQTISENTTLVPVSEIRTQFDAILKELKHSHVVIERHSKPVAVLIDPKEYKKMDEMLEHLSDVLLALEAHKREVPFKKQDYIPLEKARKYFSK